jgi:hypothetical protein
MLAGASALPERCGELASPERDVVAARDERVQLAVGAPRVPGLEVVEVGAARLLAPLLDQERGDQPPERVGVELGDAELAARQARDGGRRQLHRGRQHQWRGRRRYDVALELAGLAHRVDGRRGLRRKPIEHLPRFRRARIMSLIHGQREGRRPQGPVAITARTQGSAFGTASSTRRRRELASPNQRSRPTLHHRSDLKAALISSPKTSGSSHAAKCPPLSTSWK